MKDRVESARQNAVLRQCRQKKEKTGLTVSFTGSSFVVVRCLTAPCWGKRVDGLEGAEPQRFKLETEKARESKAEG